MHQRSPDRRLDLLLACALLALGQLEVELRGTDGPPVAAHALWAAAALAVLWRRSHPLLFFAWAMTVQALASSLDLAPPAAAIHALYTPLALFGLGAYVRDPRRAVAAAVLGLGGVLALRLGLDLAGAMRDRAADEWVREAGIFAPAAAGGVILRDRAEALRAARRRVQAEARGAAVVDLALTRERTRIARELHAVVSGCARAIVVEVATARTALAAGDGAAGAALRRARRASEQAMSEMRRMLMLLRSEAPAPLRDAAGASAPLREPAPREPAPRQPAPRQPALHEPAPREPALREPHGERSLPATARIAQPADPRAPRRSRRRGVCGRTAALLRAQGIPLLLLAIELSEALLAAGRPAEFYGSAPVPVRVAGAVAISLAFVPRRRWPLATVLAVVAIAAVRSLLLDEAFGLSPPLYLAAFVAGAYVHSLWAAALAGVLAAAGGVAIVGLLFDWDWETYPPNVLLFFVTMTTAAWITGVGGRRRLTEAAELRALAAEEERFHAAATERRVNAERLRVARELHDLVGHGLTSITLQCAVAERQLDVRPAVAAGALTAVADAGEEVLRELHELLAALDGRREAQAPPLTQLPELARRAREQGLAVRLELAGEVAGVPPGPAGAAYRIVQEALTNVRKHAGAVDVAVRVAVERDRIAIAVRDAGARAGAAPAAVPATGGGLGLLGMRERVRVYDGRLAAGSAPGGGWAVHAELPLPLRAPALEQSGSGRAAAAPQRESGAPPSSTRPLS